MDAREPIVSAIVSTYNSERFMRGLLEDLENQTIVDELEIIIIDSASPQGERRIVEEFQDRFTNIRYVRTEQRETLYRAWNRGVQLARGKYVTTANTDDRHRADAFEVLVQTLEQNKQAVLAYADVFVTFDENTLFEDCRSALLLKWPDFDVRRLFRTPYIGSQPLWLRELHSRYGFFDEAFRVAADYDFWLRVAIRESFVHVSVPLGLYLASPTSIEHSDPSVCWSEAELARERNWPEEWGKRPRPGGVFLRADVPLLVRYLATGTISPLRDVLRQGAMLVAERLRRIGGDSRMTRRKRIS
jgi:glycosyltransferase involved in cell wall biosynthesis